MSWVAMFRKKLLLIFVLVGVAVLNGCAYLDPYAKTGDNTTDNVYGEYPISDSYPVESYPPVPSIDTTPSYPTPPSTEPVTAVDTTTYHVVQPGENLYRISLTYGRTVAELAQWNGLIPPYLLEVGQRLKISGAPISRVTPPIVNAPVVSAPVAEPAPVMAATYYHTVQKGETLYRIAKSYGYNVEDVASWNKIASPYDLSSGQVLRVSPDSGQAAPAPSQSVARQAGHSQYYTVQKGDTLYSIAKRHGYNVDQVMAWNGLPSYNLSVGQRLAVSPAGNQIATSSVRRSSSGGSGYHVVGRGETLYSIAKRYNRTVAQVAAWNGLYTPYTLHIGQRLRITPPTSNNQIISSKSKPATLTPVRRVINQPAAPKPVKKSANRAPIIFYTVGSGDTLSSIASKYGLTAEELALWNGIGKPYTVYPGQRLQIVPY